MYIGRFAPTPSGPLHFGSLVAAVGSYLQAKTQQGKWLLRIEDTDLQRNQKGADIHIIKTLESFGFEWDDDIIYQTQRSERYEHALANLQRKQGIYACNCSRKQIVENGVTGQHGIIYSGTCVNKGLNRSKDTAIRLKTTQENISFTDIIYGQQQQNIAEEVGDFHLVRRDQCYAYHLATVVDDYEQGISEVVRGYDILDSTPRQIFLQHNLGYPTPNYLHLPLVIDETGKKLSKHTFADAIDSQASADFLYKALQFLGQTPDANLQKMQLQDIWQWAFENWRTTDIPRTPEIFFSL